MDESDNFKAEVAANIQALASDRDIAALSRLWMRLTAPHKYSYNFRWLGLPAIQFPQDQVAMQELIWTVRPDLIIETGIAHGGSLIFSASMLALLDYCDAVGAGAHFKPTDSGRRVLGIDIDIRRHNRAAIESHPLSHKLSLIEGSSIDKRVVAEVQAIARNYNRVLVCLDSMHTHDHVLAELDAYAPLVNRGSYCVVFDTMIEDVPKELFSDRPWGPGNNPKTAVWEWLTTHPEFEIDRSIPDKLQITVAPDGFLKRVR